MSQQDPLLNNENFLTLITSANLHLIKSDIFLPNLTKSRRLFKLMFDGAI